jgi:hypothetical protein
VLLYYLSNILYTLLPLLQQANRLRLARTGKFAHIEEPEQALRYDAGVRNMNLDTFPDLRGIIIKSISVHFRTRAEKAFDMVLE